MSYRMKTHSDRSQKPLRFSKAGKEANAQRHLVKVQKRRLRASTKLQTVETPTGVWTARLYEPYLLHEADEAEDAVEIEGGDEVDQSDEPANPLEVNLVEEGHAHQTHMTDNVSKSNEIYLRTLTEAETQRWYELDEEDVQDTVRKTDMAGDADATACQLNAGVNMELSFEPHSTLERTGSVRLIQFKKPIHPDDKREGCEMTVDAWSASMSPYFGWDEKTDTPKKMALKYNDEGDLLEGARNTPLHLVGRDMVREGKVKRAPEAKNPTKKKQPSETKHTQKGRAKYYATKESTSAYLIDLPREPCPVGRGKSRDALFLTYAYDLKNKCWLGGVSWGYTVSVDQDGHPTVQTRQLCMRSQAGLQPEEQSARDRWNQKLGRQPVPM